MAGEEGCEGGRPGDWESDSSELTPHFATSDLQASSLL